jgi:hypothetical protein
LSPTLNQEPEVRKHAQESLKISILFRVALFAVKVGEEMLSPFTKSALFESRRTAPSLFAAETLGGFAISLTETTLTSWPIRTVISRRSSFRNRPPPQLRKRIVVNLSVDLEESSLRLLRPDCTSISVHYGTRPSKPNGNAEFVPPPSVKNWNSARCGALKKGPSELKKKSQRVGLSSDRISPRPAQNFKRDELTFLVILWSDPPK